MKLTEVHKELLGIAAALAALCVTVTVFASEVIIIAQKDRKFQAETLDIAVGDTIRFTNEDSFIHQLYVDSPGFSFSSEGQPKGMILPVPFPVAGTFEVRCEIHPKMLLTVNVR